VSIFSPSKEVKKIDIDPDRCGTIRVEVPGPPVGKGRPRFGQGRTYTPAKTVRYEQRLAAEAARTMAELRLAPLTGPLRVDVVAWLPVPRSWSRKRQRAALSLLELPCGGGTGDSDNFIKVLDACNGILWEDDCQICDAHVRKFYAVEPKLVVMVSRLGHPEPAA
jgi:Holliday junction resolvase RusA-like endonuclease